MLNPMRDKNEGTYRGGEGTTPVTTACPEDRWGYNFLRLKLESKSNGKKKKYFEYYCSARSRMLSLFACLCVFVHKVRFRKYQVLFVIYRWHTLIIKNWFVSSFPFVSGCIFHLLSYANSRWTTQIYSERAGTQRTLRPQLLCHPFLLFMAVSMLPNIYTHYIYIIYMVFE